MKKIIIPILIILLASVTSNAQIKRPPVKVNKAEVKSKIEVQDLQIKNLSQLTIDAFMKLDIPVAQTTQEKLNARPAQTWRINPQKWNYGNLKLEYFYGLCRNNEWTYATLNGDYFRNSYHKELLDNRLENNQIGSTVTHFPWNFWPVKMSFRVSGGVDYILRFDDRLAQQGDYIYVLKDSEYATRINVNQQGQYIFGFKEESSKEITLHFTGSFKQVKFGFVKLSELRIDRLPPIE